MAVARSLVKLSLGSVCVFGSLAFPALSTGTEIVWKSLLMTGLGSVAAGNTANAFDEILDVLTEGKDPDRVELENEDLTKTVGKAIAAVITSPRKNGAIFLSKILGCKLRPSRAS